MTILPLVLALVTTVVGVALFARAVARIVGVVKTGQPTLGRADDPASRWKTLLVETVGHTRMLQWSKIGIAHWFVFVGFLYLFFTLVTAFGQIFAPDFALPLIGHWVVYEWVTELLAWVMLGCILYLIANRLNITGRATQGARGRFFGSHTWQAYYVELTILGIALCILFLRALEYQLSGDRFHFPLTFFLLPALDPATAEVAIVWVASLKIIISMAWFCVLGLNLTMGVAWHRFSAWPNIWFKRYASGQPSLGALPPVNVGGRTPDLTDEEAMDEEVFGRLGVGSVEDFSWKGLLDFTSCTECGRCQSQCPAWNTEKPLSPKLLMMGLREHAYAKAPYLQAAESARGSLPGDVLAEAERPLVGATVGEGGDARAAAVAQAHGDPISIGADGSVAVVDADVLWSCTSCGACVQQCPVDIEHVDHIIDMRRFQVMVEGEFPTELNGLYKGLESKGNPWNMNRRGRLDWAKDLPFDVPVVGEDVADLTEVEYLFWVGCAGAYEDRAKKTTQAVAELLDVAGVSFAVLGNGETCTGDPARRSGNEMVFQQLAAENKETLTDAKASKVVTTCAHCLNTLKNEYPQIGVELEVVHHTQLLNRLVRDGRLTPLAAPEGSVAGRTITYHDPCYLGRHNKVYDAPRDLLGAIPGATYAEMPRARETSFCCGAGGARMWMEEKIGTRINANRTAEALTVLDQAPNAAVATGCPFCRVMLSDGLTAEQAGGRGENVEVLDVAQLLLEGVRRGQAPAEDTPATLSDDTPDTLSERAQRDEEEPASPDHSEEAAEARKADDPGTVEDRPAEPAPSEAPQDGAATRTSGAAAAAGGAALGAISLKDLAAKAKTGGTPTTPATKATQPDDEAPAAEKPAAQAPEPEPAAQTSQPETPAPTTAKTAGAISLKDLAAKAKSGGSPSTGTTETTRPDAEAPEVKDTDSTNTSAEIEPDDDAKPASEKPAQDTEKPTTTTAKTAGAISLKDLAAKAKSGGSSSTGTTETTRPDAEAPAAEQLAAQAPEPEPAAQTSQPEKPTTTAKTAGAISLKDLAAKAKTGGAPSTPATETTRPDDEAPEVKDTDSTITSAEIEPADDAKPAGEKPAQDVDKPNTTSAKATATAKTAGAISLRDLAARAKAGRTEARAESTGAAPQEAATSWAEQALAPKAEQAQAPATEQAQALRGEQTAATETESGPSHVAESATGTPSAQAAPTAASGQKLSLAELAERVRNRPSE